MAPAILLLGVSDNSFQLISWASNSLIASYGGPANFSGRLHASANGWNGTGDLEFMNNWKYKLGEEGKLSIIKPAFIIYL